MKHLFTPLIFLFFISNIMYATQLTIKNKTFLGLLIVDIFRQLGDMEPNSERFWQRPNHLDFRLDLYYDKKKLDVDNQAHKFIKIMSYDELGNFIAEIKTCGILEGCIFVPCGRSFTYTVEIDDAGIKNYKIARTMRREIELWLAAEKKRLAKIAGIKKKLDQNYEDSQYLKNAKEFWQHLKDRILKV